MKRHLVYWLVAWFYDYLASRDRDSKVTFMNFGFASTDLGTHAIGCSQDDPEVRRKALYWEVADGIGDPGWDWRGKEVLEVGSGRGGGAAYLSSRLEPRSYQCVDLSGKAVRFCQEKFFHTGLSFIQGNAENLPFPDQSFDVVINLESSHCYPRMRSFLEEVRRVLRPEGYLLLADFRRKVEMEQFQQDLRGSGLMEISREDITPNVLAALRQDSEANLALVREYVPWWLHWLFRPFAGVENSGMPESFASRDRVYLSFVFQKPA